MTFLSFVYARKFVRKLGLKSQSEWKQYCQSGKLSLNIPRTPEGVYKNSNEWNGWGDWLGTGNIANQNKKYRAFTEAKNFVRTLHLETGKEWIAYCKSGKKPGDVPNAPWHVYKDRWIDMGDWLGTGYIATYKRNYRPFNDAREFIRNLRLKSGRDWKTYCNSGKKPADIPSSPVRSYGKEWKGIDDWLGTGQVSPKDRKYKPFEKARKFVRRLKLANGKEWRNYTKSGTKPNDIPGYPECNYKDQWEGIDDWLGTGQVSPKDREYLPFQKAREFVHKLKLNNGREWKDYYNSGKKPVAIPSNPARIYKKEWNGMGDWLGTGFVALSQRKYQPFKKARDFVRNLSLTDVDEWKQYCKSKQKPFDIPIYESEWIDWFDWLGTIGMTWDVPAVKELLRDLIASKVLFEWDEAVLYSFLNRKGVLNLAESNRHRYLFKNLIEACKTEEGRRKIEEYVKSDSKTPPDFSMISVQDDASEIVPATPLEIFNIAGTADPLDYDNISSVEQALEHTNILESINVDEEAMQFYLNYSVD